MKLKHKLSAFLYLLPLALLPGGAVQAQAPDPEVYEQRQKAVSAAMEAEGLAEPFKGITASGEVIPGLFPIRSTGVSTAPLRQAADDFLTTLSPGQREAATFPVDDEEWRKWGNQHIYYRQGISFEHMSEAQREAAFTLLDVALSPKGFELARDIMRLNETLGELNGDNFVEYGEFKYFLSFMGTPSASEPWGFQLDGHHLILNYFVLGNQVVMTPAFWGSEPAVAASGKYAGLRIMDAEQEQALALIRALDENQRDAAIIDTDKAGNNILTQAFSDNVIVEHAGIPVSNFTDTQRGMLIDLISLYIGNMEAGHAEVTMRDIAGHLDDTWFAWIGGTDDASVFYYRIQSPVILIEFDHQAPVGLTHLYPRGVPYKEHIHAVVRTPNGNDYGKDLLRQHYERHPH